MGEVLHDVHKCNCLPRALSGCLRTICFMRAQHLLRVLFPTSILPNMGKLSHMPRRCSSPEQKSHRCETSFSHNWLPTHVGELIHVLGTCSLLFSKARQPTLFLLSSLSFLSQKIECKLEFFDLALCDWSRRHLDLISKLPEPILGIFGFVCSI